MGEAGEVSPAGGGGWAAWQPLDGVPRISVEVLRETLDGGQAFRWNRQPDGTWLGIWGRHVARLRHGVDDHVEWSAPETSRSSTVEALAAYFATDRDFTALADTLPWRSDPHLARCLDAYRGLRILRQPFGETLLGFLCSATKQIVQIKQMLALLAERHGAPIIMPEPEGGAAKSGHGEVGPGMGSVALAREAGPDRTFDASPRVHRLPTWAELAEIPETDLRACLLGFRARYIAETARWIAANPGWLEETEAAPYAIAKERLCSLAGVGEKVADCVLLFGAGRLEAFPVDTWILKALARRYGLEGWKPAQVAQFGRAHFGPLAGYAQQFLFAYERSASAAEPAAPGGHGATRKPPRH